MQVLVLLVGRVGFEPTTYGLRGAATKLTMHIEQPLTALAKARISVAQP